MTDAEINKVLEAAKVPEPPEGWEQYDLQVARAILAAVEPERDRWAAEAMKWRRKYSDMRFPGLVRVVKPQEARQ